MALGVCQAAERAVEAALAQGPVVLLGVLGLAIVGTALVVYMVSVCIFGGYVCVG